ALHLVVGAGLLLRREVLLEDRGGHVDALPDDPRGEEAAEHERDDRRDAPFLADELGYDAVRHDERADEARRDRQDATDPRTQWDRAGIELGGEGLIGAHAGAAVRCTGRAFSLSV